MPFSTFGRFQEALENSFNRAMSETIELTDVMLKSGGLNTKTTYEHIVKLDQDQLARMISYITATVTIIENTDYRDSMEEITDTLEVVYKLKKYGIIL